MIGDLGLIFDRGRPDETRGRDVDAIPFSIDDGIDQRKAAVTPDCTSLSAIGETDLAGDLGRFDWIIHATEQYSVLGSVLDHLDGLE